MKKLMTAFVALAAVLAFVSCASAKVEDKESVMANNQNLAACEGNWQLVFFSKDGVAQTLGLTDLTLKNSGSSSFDLSGSIAGNRFMGKVTSPKEGKVKVNPFVITRMAVPPELAEFESLFCEFLNGIDSYKILDASGTGTGVPALRLENSKMKTRAEFQKNSIFRKQWNVVALNDGNAVVTVDTTANMSLDGDIAAIFTGINQLNLPVAVSESKGEIAFQDGPMTRAAGSEEDMRVEGWLVKDLFKTSRYELSGKTLSFYGNTEEFGDTLLIEFAQQDYVR